MEPPPRRQPHTFILTVLLVDPEHAGLRGRVRSLASEREATFTQMAELIQFVTGEVDAVERPRTSDSAGDAESRNAPA